MIDHARFLCFQSLVNRSVLGFTKGREKHRRSRLRILYNTSFANLLLWRLVVCIKRPSPHRTGCKQRCFFHSTVWCRVCFHHHRCSRCSRLCFNHSSHRFAVVLPSFAKTSGLQLSANLFCCTVAATLTDLEDEEAEDEEEGDGEEDAENQEKATAIWSHFFEMSDSHSSALPVSLIGQMPQVGC